MGQAAWHVYIKFTKSVCIKLFKLYAYFLNIWITNAKLQTTHELNHPYMHLASQIYMSPMFDKHWRWVMITKVSLKIWYKQKEHPTTRGKNVCRT